MELEVLTSRPFGALRVGYWDSESVPLGVQSHLVVEGQRDPERVVAHPL